MSEIKITDFIEFNPKRVIKRGEVAPFVDMAALPENSRDISRVSARKFKGSGSKFINGDTLFSRITPCLENGKTAKVSGLPEDKVASGSTEFIVMAAKEPDYDEDYIYYLARLPEFRSFAEARMEGTSGRQRVPWQALAEFEFAFPAQKERKEIGLFFRKIDDKIELNRKINQTLEEMAQAIFKSWFVDFEPVKAKIKAKQAGGNAEQIRTAAMCAISGKTEAELANLPQETLTQLKTNANLFPEAMQDSELGDIPEGWRIGLLSELCELNSSSWTKKSAPNEVWYIDLANTKNGVIEEIKYFDWETAPSRARRILNHGDTIVGTVRPGNRSFAFIGKTKNQLTGSTGFAVLSPKKEVYREFVYISVTGEQNIERLAHLADGAAYPAVKPDTVSKQVLVIPPETLMSGFSRVVKPFFSLNHENKSATEKLSELRDVLLPKLLSNDIVLKESM